MINYQEIQKVWRLVMRLDIFVQNTQNCGFLMSFADERCGGYGIVYQAANFQYYGEHTNIFWESDWQYFHNVIMTNGSDQSKQARILRARKDEAQKIELRQFRYIYWLNQRYKKECKLKEQPYLKHYAEKPNGFEKTEAGGAILNFFFFH